MEKNIRDSVNEFYSSAAIKPLEPLCCASSYHEADVAHIPKEVLEVSYGCGSPIPLAGIKEGEVLADLGSGGGIDCFIAAKQVGRRGRVYGVDMTDKMLERAQKASSQVARNLGYDVVEFRKGYLEELPLEDGTADVVTSNCVINLSPDKTKVLREIFRVLKGNGRFCVSDIVSDKVVPEAMRDNEKLWGECVSGAMTEDELIKTAQEAGFYGLRILSRGTYRSLEGIRFYSITLAGRKAEKGTECVYAGHRAIYNGPFQSVRDDEGHEYPAGQAVEVCTDTAEKLKNPPYSGLFTITAPEEAGGDAGRGPKKCC